MYRAAAQGGSDEPDGKPRLKQGSTGAYVTELQTGLLTLGYSLPNYGADGSYGDETVAAVRAFQADAGIKVDGICGADTWNALDAQLKDIAHSDGIFTVTADSLNVRKGPGASYEIYTVVHNGDMVLSLSMAGWAPILRGGQVQYVSRGYASISAGQAMITGESVYVRVGPGTEYEPATVAHKYDVFTIVDISGWTPIKLNGTVYYVRSLYVS